MGRRNKRPSAKEISDRASQWLFTLEAKPEVKLWDEFQVWLDSDPRHRAAFIRLRVAWNNADVLKNARPADGRIDASLLAPDRAAYSEAEAKTRPLKEEAAQTLPGKAKRPESDHHRRIVLPPGNRLAEIAEFLLTREAYHRYVAPTIADMQKEYIECLAKGDVWRARWIAVRGHILVIPGWMYALAARAVMKIFNAGT